LTRPDGAAALVTGASRGIGAAVARALARDGWVVGVNYRSDPDAARAVVEQIEVGGGTAAALHGDVTAADDVEGLFKALEERHGPVLCVVNNAGVRADGLAARLAVEDWRRLHAVNLDAAFLVARRALGPMLRARFGRIVNVASGIALRANPGQSAYTAAKSGLIGFTRALATEVARRGVTVNAVAPGVIDTEMVADVLAGAAEHIPARRVGTPDEVAACVRFLTSDEAAYVNGATLAVDGALTA
jgi:3-oxoacyl-[acyl-carrier protein] reductase